MRRWKNDPDRPLMLAAKLWASAKLGVRLVYANDHKEEGAVWVCYHPSVYIEQPAQREYPPRGGCFMLLRPTRAKH